MCVYVNTGVRLCVSEKKTKEWMKWVEMKGTKEKQRKEQSSSMMMRSSCVVAYARTAYIH